jgi:E3 ubiquitin-protein ligase mind-bomb
MEPVEDLRVVRGPDWEHGDEDGGEGHVGTVVKVHRASEPAASATESAESSRGEREGSKERSPGAELEHAERGEVHNVTVQWDCGHRGVYKCGMDGKYELRIIDTGQSGITSGSVTCDGCRAAPVVGIRWKCSQCYDYDLCTSCYMSNEHSEAHRFVRYDDGGRLRSMMGCRQGARTVECMGIFPLAEVVRGHDWCWGQQDGGSGTVGKVTGISNWEDTHYRASVEVEWPEVGRKNYRVGCQGMVDLKYVTPASCGKYYPDHLQVLGAPPCPPQPSEFASSDYVRMELDMEIFEMLQQTHGGWNPAMADLRGELGVVHSIMDNGDLRVSYGSRNWVLNPSALVKADVPRYKRGDVVRVMDDLTEVTKLQKNHGGWNDEMTNAVGQLGSVQGVNNDGNVAVLMKTHLWTFNPLCLRHAEKEEEQEVSSSVVLGEETQLLELRMQALQASEDSEVLHHAALLGNLSVIREYLDKYPNEVDAKFTGKTALHCAAAAGKMNVVEALLELGANIECEDEVGHRPLHHCAIREQSEVATVLVNGGADPNSKAHNDQTPLILAALKGNMKVLAVLLHCPNIKLHEQDKDGDTALHCTIHGRRYQSMCALLDAGADPSLVNFNIYTPLHLAVKVGFLPAVESIVKSHPEHVNVREQLACTPLHLAATEGEIEVARTLLNTEDPKAETGHTPLHGALMKDHSKMVELLVGYGADPTISNNDDITPLHFALGNNDLHPPSDTTPQLNEVKGLLVEMTGEVSGQLVVACFLIREGADITSVNSNGQTPLDACSPAMAVIVSEFSQKYAGSGKYRGSLRAPQQTVSTHSSGDNTDNQTKEEVPNQVESNKVPESTVDNEGGQKVPLQPTANHPVAASPASIPDSVKVPDTIPSQTSPILTATTPELCFLCDSPITIKFEPCGHSTVCENCAKRARKCPECKTPVQALSELQV